MGSEHISYKKKSLKFKLSETHGGMGKLPASGKQIIQSDMIAKKFSPMAKHLNIGELC